LVYDHRLLPHLAEEVAVEVGVAADCGVRQVHITDTAAGHLLHLAPVVLDPCQVAQASLAGDGHDRDLARIHSGGIRTDPNHDRLAWGAFKEAVWVGWRANFAPLYSQQVLARRDVHARLRERRFQAGIPVFPVVHTRETIAPVL